MYRASVPVALQALERALALLEKTTPEMLQARLHPDMFACAEQFEVVASFALRATFPLTGKAPPDLPEGDPQAALVLARDAVRGLTMDDFLGADQQRIHHVAGFTDLDQSAQDYLQHFALPNLWFHLSMAFAIMRQRGADIGKADYDGLHLYPADFSFPD